MKVTWKDPADAAQLQALIDSQSKAKQRDRYRVVLLADRGWETSPSCSGKRLPRWPVARVSSSTSGSAATAAAGSRGLLPRRQKAAACKLGAGQRRQPCKLLDEGPTADEGIAAYNGPILREKVEECFGKTYSLGGVYHLLHRLGYNDLMPRPKHPDTDPTASEALKKAAGIFGSAQAAHPDKRVLSYYQDEARFGRHGTLARVWARVGTRPGALRQTQYDYLYVFTAASPQTGAASGLITPKCEYVDDEFVPGAVRQRTADRRARGADPGPGPVARGQGSDVPGNVTLIHLRPKSPELNPTENLWHYLRSHYWSNRLYLTWDDLRAAAVDAWRNVYMVPELVRSVCADTSVRNLRGIRIIPTLASVILTSPSRRGKPRVDWL